MSHLRKLSTLTLSLFLWLYAVVALAGPPPEGGTGGAEAPATEAAAAATEGMSTWEFIQYQANAMLSDEGLVLAGKVVLAIVLLLVGWIVAKLIEWAVFHALKRTDVDDRIAERLGINLLLVDENGKPKQEDALERVVGRVFFWLAMLMVFVAVLEALGLGQAAKPLENLVHTVVQALPLIGKAAVILLLAFLVGSGLRKLATIALDRFGLDRRVEELAEQQKAEGEAEASLDAPKPFSETAGQVVFWLVMLVGLAGAFDALQIEPLSGPLRNAVDQIVGLLPSLGAAALLVVGGWILGRIVRAILSNLLQSVGFDQLVERTGFSSIFGELGPSKVVGIVAMAFVVLQAAIAALDRVGLNTLSEPLTLMMTRFWATLPTIAVAALIVGLGIVVGRLLRTVVASTLRNLGFEKLMARVGFEKIANREDRLGEPSELAGFIVQISVILIAVAQALNQLDLQTWAVYVDNLLTFTITRAAVAVAIVGLGFLIGNYVRDIIHARQQEPGTHGPRWIGDFSRYAILVFAFTMAVHQVGVAEDFVLVSFALLFGSLCLAAALAFGLGARDVAGEIVKQRWQSVQRESREASKPGNPGASGTPGVPGSPAPSAPGGSLFLPKK